MRCHLRKSCERSLGSAPSKTGLGRRARVSGLTVRSFEKGLTTPNPATLAVIQAAFEKAGVEFLNDDRPGVRMKRKPRK